MLTGSSLAVSKEYLFPPSSYKAPCDTSKTTVCTIEIWLAHKHKKQKKELRGFLKARAIKVLNHTIQFWRPKVGDILRQILLLAVRLAPKTHAW